MSAVDRILTVLGLPRRHRPLIQAELDRVGGVGGLARGARGGPLEAQLPAGARARWAALGDLLAECEDPRPLPPRITSADDVAAYFATRVARLPEERVFVLSLDARARPLGVAQIAQGTLTACLVHPREVFAPAIEARAAQVVVVHNHPSGDEAPSPEDHALTARLVEAGRILGIPVLDHVIVTRRGHRSLGPLG